MVGPDGLERPSRLYVVDAKTAIPAPDPDKWITREEARAAMIVGTVMFWAALGLGLWLLLR